MHFLVRRFYAHMMNRTVLILLLATSTFAAEPSTRFDGPVRDFSSALVPLLTSFEQASITTTLRGFFARGDSFPAYRRAESDLSNPGNAPSEYGLFLSVATSEDVTEFSDHTKQKDGLTHRLLQIPPPKIGQQALVIELHYGSHVLPEVVHAIDASISNISKQSHRVAKLSTLRTQWSDNDRHSIRNLFSAFLRQEKRFQEELAAHAGRFEEISSGDHAVGLKCIREALKRAFDKNRTSEDVSAALATEIRSAIEDSERTTKLIPGVVILPR
jgi:hypothetical protein